MVQIELGRARLAAVCLVTLTAGCPDNAIGPGGPRDAGPGGDSISFSDLRPTVDGEATPDAAPGIALAQLAAAIKQAKCEGMAACGLAPDLARCLDAVVGGMDLARLTASVAAGRASYDAVAAQACVEQFRGVGCPVIWFTQAELSAECRKVFGALLAVGGACYLDKECQSGRCRRQACPNGVTCCPGECLDVPLVGLGEDCSAARCPEGAICFDQVIGPPLCDTISVVDEDCWQNSDCIEGAFCGGAFQGSLPGKCYVPAGEGQSCTGLPATPACIRLDNWCDPADEICKPRIKPGGSCNPTLQNCLGHCDSTKHCVALAGPGEPCDVFSAQCMGNLWCNVDGICALEDEPAVCP